MSLLHTLSDLAIRYLPKKQFEQLRSSYIQIRSKLNPVIKKFYGSYNIDDLKAHLEATIDPDFEILMVHSSVNHMLPMYTGTPLELVNMLLEFCGPDRTLAMPTFYFGDPKIGSVQETFRKNPVCNLKRLPSQMGLMTELFRRSKGVLQSRHPVYRVAAFGPLATALTSGHENASGPAGFGSPFEFMAKHNTMVIGIGKSFHVMTQVHFVEELMGEDFPAKRAPVEERTETPITVIDGDEQVPVTLKDNGIRWRFNISKLPGLLNPGDIKYWKFHNTPLFAGHAGKVTNSLLAAGKKGLCIYDPN